MSIRRMCLPETEKPTVHIFLCCHPKSQTVYPEYPAGTRKAQRFMSLFRPFSYLLVLWIRTIDGQILWKTCAGGTATKCFATAQAATVPGRKARARPCVLVDDGTPPEQISPEGGMGQGRSGTGRWMIRPERGMTSAVPLQFLHHWHASVFLGYPSHGLDKPSILREQAGPL